MSKWADYAITAVSYDNDHDHIQQLEVREDLGSSLGSPTIESRQRVVNSIKRGNTYVTATEDENDKWQKGDDVSIIRVNGVDYLRTDGNSRASDNLGELPEF